MSSNFCINLRNVQNKLTFNATSTHCLQSSSILHHTTLACIESNRNFKSSLWNHFNSISQDCCVGIILVSKSITTSFHLSLLFTNLYLNNYSTSCAFLNLHKRSYIKFGHTWTLRISWQFTRNIALMVLVSSLKAIFTTFFWGQKHNHYL